MQKLFGLEFLFYWHFTHVTCFNLLRASNKESEMFVFDCGSMLHKCRNVTVHQRNSVGNSTVWTSCTVKEMGIGWWLDKQIFYWILNLIKAKQNNAINTLHYLSESYLIFLTALTFLFLCTCNLICKYIDNKGIDLWYENKFRLLMKWDYSHFR